MPPAYGMRGRVNADLAHLEGLFLILFLEIYISIKVLRKAGLKSAGLHDEKENLKMTKEKMIICENIQKKIADLGLVWDLSGEPKLIGKLNDELKSLLRNNFAIMKEFAESRKSVFRDYKIVPDPPPGLGSSGNQPKHIGAPAITRLN